MSLLGGGKSNEFTFQNDIIRQLVANGWLLGKPENYNRELALYEEDLLGFLSRSHAPAWECIRVQIDHERYGFPSGSMGTRRKNRGV